MTYEKQINEFIPIATKMADQVVATLPIKSYEVIGVDGKPCVFDTWTAEFHKAMGRLTSEAGLRVLRG